MTADRDALVKRLQALFPEQEGCTIADQSYAGISYSTVREIIALLTAPAEAPVMMDGLTVDECICLWSMRPQPGTPTGKAWEDGARQGWAWAQSRLAAPLPQSAPVSREAVIEECAKVIDRMQEQWHDSGAKHSGHYMQAAHWIAEELRSLAAHPAEPAGKESV